MSKRNGNGPSRFDQFHKRVGKLPFAPDFLDSLVRRMATADLTEATFAWTMYRAWGNSSEDGAIHIFSRNGDKPKETFLRQCDCALELAWLQAGHRAEWLDAPLHVFREEAALRKIEPIPKTLICDAFTENRERGTVASGTGYRLVPVLSPQVADSPEKLGEYQAKGHLYKQFLSEWSVAHSAETQLEADARSTIKRINKVRLSDYKTWRKSQAHRTNRGPSLEALEALETLEALTSEAAASPAPVSVPGKVVGRSVGSAEVTEPAYLPTVSLPIKAEPEPEPLAPHEQRELAALEELAELVAAVEEVAVPVIGEQPTSAQYFEIQRRLKGATVPLFKTRMKAKKARGELKSIMLLPLLADDCAKAQPRRAVKPPPESSPPCPQCQGTGLIGGHNWRTEPELRALRDRGAQACGCDDGALVRRMSGETKTVSKGA